jgi:hypothetical protein
MALDFNASGRRIIVPSSASLDNFTSFSGIVWINLAALAKDDYILFKGNAGGLRRWRLILDDTSGNLQFVVDRTTGLGYTTTSTIGASTGSWEAFAFSYDNSDSTQSAHKIFKGTLTSAFVEEGIYGAGQGSANSIATDQDGDLAIGINPDALPTSFLNGSIAVVKLFDSLLTLDEFIAEQWIAHTNRTDCVYNPPMGFTGTTTQVDLSGNANNGTITGATISDHVPLPSPFGFAESGIRLGSAASSITTYTKSLSGSITPTGDAINSLMLISSLSGSVSVSGGILKRISKSSGGSVTSTGGISKQAEKSIGGSVTLVGRLINEIRTKLIGAVSLSGTPNEVFVSLITIAGSFTLSGAVNTLFVPYVAATRAFAYIRGVVRGVIKDRNEDI